MTTNRSISPGDRHALNQAAAESNYKGGALFARLQFKEDGDAESSMLKPVTFQGFANTGRPDLGDDIVEPEAFGKAAIAEYLKFGRQLFFMHNPYAQVGEITAADVVAKGQRSLFGIKDGGLLVKGFVDSPIDPETGWIPDHELAKVIHFARMQVRRGRLKLMSIGWRPTKTEAITAADPRRGNEQRRFRLVKSLILSEISLVTMAMSPQSLLEVQGAAKALAHFYGQDVADAIFEDAGGLPAALGAIPEKVDDLTVDRLRGIFAKVAGDAEAAILAARAGAPAPAPDDDTPDTLDTPEDEGDSPKLNLVRLNQAPPADRKLNLVTLSKG
jgi:hypothetical protein